MEEESENISYIFNCNFMLFMYNFNHRTHNVQTVIQNMLHGDPKVWAKRLWSHLLHYIPGVVNPHAKVVQDWNKIFIISCSFAVLLDPFFFFLLYVQEFRLAYVAPGSRIGGPGDLIDYPKRIARNYLSGLFIIGYYTIEEKVIEMAYKKLALNALVIQQGHLAEQKTVNKDELLQMVQFGAEMMKILIELLPKEKKQLLNLMQKMKRFTEDAIKFKVDDNADLYDFEDEKDENKFDFKKIVSDNWTEPSRRERKRIYTETDYSKQTARQGGPARTKEPRIPRMPQLHDFQFFNTHRLSELYGKAVHCLIKSHKKNQDKDIIDEDNKPQDVVDPLTAEKQEEKERLLEEGFSTWSRRDFNNFIRAYEKNGRNDIVSIAFEIDGKTKEEVEQYAKVFMERYT
ncbi:hypothetical protein ACS0TY_035658 [Phlomoides rotata]